MRRFVVLVLAAWLLITPSFVAGDDSASSLLATLQKKAGDVNTLSSDFIQKKHLSLFAETMRSKGRFYFQRPDKFRWEYLSPVHSGFSIDGGQGKRWNDALEENSSFDVDIDPMMQAVVKQLMAWTVFDLDWLRREYDITVASENPVALKLTPKRSAMAEMMDHLQVEFASDMVGLRQIEIREPDNDTTVIRFTDKHVNEPMEKGLF